MTEVQHIRVDADDAEQRLDRWLRRRFPGLAYGQLAKWVRTGQVRIDGRRARPETRLQAGQEVRLPPSHPAAAKRPLPRRVSDRDRADIAASVLYRDDDLIAINKPAGLAVQGGTGQRRHLDAMLGALQADDPRPPRLVHRLDKDTSGVLLLARTDLAARRLTASFRGRDVTKLYWALVKGVPRPTAGRINLPVTKTPGPGGDRVRSGAGGQPAVTDYAVIETAARRLAWLALQPHTGRTHQLRVHCQSLGTPIVGDRKYGGPDAVVDGLAAGLHLHARRLALRHPRTGKPLEVAAPLTGHMAASCAFLGLSMDPAAADDPFAGQDFAKVRRGGRD